DPGFGLRTRDQDIGIAGAARCRRGDGANMRNLAVANMSGTNAQRRDGPLDRLVGEFAGQRHALAQPHDAREGIHDPEFTEAVRPRDQQPAIVAAEIEDGEDWRRARMPPLASLPVSGQATLPVPDPN